MDYFQYKVTPRTADLTDIIIAELGELPFDTFEEEGDTVLAYIRVPDCDVDVETAIADIKTAYNLRVERTLIPHQNWNEVWESNFQPIILDDFCAVRASFHAPITSVQYDLVIDPKMAFGTGHHETTYMMMDYMRHIDFLGKNVFDYGAGTGILAILAAKLGASHIDAVDIEHESYLSTLENAALNDTPQITSIHGTLDDVQGEGYAVIVANINRNVIIPSLPRLYAQLAEGGTILFSGILERDAPLVITAAEAEGFRYNEIKTKGDWVAIRCGK
jgi:ribosomal protein L11 methyltransferase